MKCFVDGNVQPRSYEGRESSVSKALVGQHEGLLSPQQLCAKPSAAAQMESQCWGSREIQIPEAYWQAKLPNPQGPGLKTQGRVLARRLLPMDKGTCCQSLEPTW